ncbi:MAG: hypothetical protein ACK4TA_21455 [Saprospiraceae bacterium]
MVIEIGIAIMGLVLIIVGVLSNTKKDNSKINKTGYATIVFGIIACLLSSFKAYLDDIESKSQASNIQNLNFNLSVTRDSIIKLNSLIVDFKYKIDSIEHISQSISEELQSEFKPIFSEKINLKESSFAYFEGKLLKGMKIRVTNSNCLRNVALLHNGKREVIKEDDSGAWEIIFSEDGEINKTFLSNEGSSPCGMMIEIFQEILEFHYQVKLVLLAATTI